MKPFWKRSNKNANILIGNPPTPVLMFSLQSSFSEPLCLQLQLQVQLDIPLLAAFPLLPSSPPTASFPPFLTGPTPLSLQPNVPVSWVQLASSWAGHWQEVEAMRSPVSLSNAMSLSNIQCPMSNVSFQCNLLPSPLQCWWSPSQISLLFQEQVGWGTWLVQCALSLVLNSPLSNQSLHMIFI